MLEAIRKAQARLSAYLRPSPIIYSQFLSEKCNRKVWLKLETQLPTGSFKVRPAINSLLVHLREAREAGVITSSSGNFAQGTAYAARLLGVDAEIVMMRNSSPFKIQRTKEWGGAVVLCENTLQSRWETTTRIQRETARVPIYSYDSEEAIAGDGVIGLELLEQVGNEFIAVVPVSGGGLLSGIATAVKELRPGCYVTGVQAIANGAMAKSLEEGRPVTVNPQRSLADALLVSRPGERAFSIVKRLVDEVILVTENEIEGAIRHLALQERLVIEGGGAVGVAALLAGRIKQNALDVVLILSGGNIVPATLARIASAK